jgi:16S rRNA G966 N2-methylase RsmD
MIDKLNGKKFCYKLKDRENVKLIEGDCMEVKEGRDCEIIFNDVGIGPLTTGDDEGVKGNHLKQVDMQIEWLRQLIEEKRRGIVCLKLNCVLTNEDCERLYHCVKGFKFTMLKLISSGGWNFENHLLINLMRRNENVLKKRKFIKRLFGFYEENAIIIREWHKIRRIVVESGYWKKNPILEDEIYQRRLRQKWFVEDVNLKNLIIDDTNLIFRECYAKQLCKVLRMKKIGKIKILETHGGCGSMSIQIKKRLKESCEIVSFEINKKRFELLKENIKINEMKWDVYCEDWKSVKNFEKFDLVLFDPLYIKGNYMREFKNLFRKMRKCEVKMCFIRYPKMLYDQIVNYLDNMKVRYLMINLYGGTGMTLFEFRF